MLPHTDKTIWVVITLILFLFVGNFVFTQYQIRELKNNLSTSPTTNLYTNPLVNQSDCGPECQKYIATLFASAKPASLSPTTSPNPTPLPKSSSTPAALRITYIPLTGGSTTATDWTNISGSQFTLNITDYGSRAYAIWDANLRVDNSNGTTFARLFDTTHGIAINGSEIKITNISSSTNVTSGSLSFWQGNNTYVVQIKSLNSSTAYLDSGRIKINY